MTVKLSIGIPTYNGAKSIKETLESILKQLDTINESIEILISDNASTDNTKDIIQEYINKYPKIFSYYKNEENIGYDRNVDNIFKKAKGEYVWLLGDDDVYYEGSLNYLFNILNGNNIDIVLSNFDFYDYEMKNLTHRMTLNYGQDLKCKNHNEFIIKSESRYSSLSSLIIKKDIWNSFDVSKGFGSLYIHKYVLLNILPKCSSYIITKPLVKVRHGLKRYYKCGDDKILILIKCIEITKSLNKRLYDKKVYKNLLSFQRKHLFAAIEEIIKQAPINKKRIIIELFKYNYDYLPFYQHLYKLILMPNPN